MKYSQPSTIHISTAWPAPPPKRPTSPALVINRLVPPDITLAMSGLKLTSSSGVCRIRYVASSKKGKPKPSLEPASAEMISRSARGTYLSANGPLAIACERTGSVDVTSDPITWESLSVCSGYNVCHWCSLTMAVSVVSFGIMSLMQPVVHSHMIVMTGISNNAMSLHRCHGYFAGN
jgi:hypothetical protein